MLNKHFQEFIELLEKNKVRYLVVGGYAVGLHGFPRYTGDIDFFIGISEENAKLILKTFQDFGFGDLGVTEADFLEEEMVVEIGREPLKIQILTGIDGVTFEECWEDRKEVRMSGMEVPFIGIESLLKNKAASPRAKDRIDLEELKRIKNEDDGFRSTD
ncbi:MAG: nucleotidyltransferase [Opitutales bacterium]|nr:nucleotidyltransferase [Opitutales bacterium]